MSPPPRSEVLEQERRWSRRAGVAGLIAVGLFVASIVIQQVGLEATDTDAGRLEQFDQNSGQLLSAEVLRSIAYALFSLPLYFLFLAARNRSDQVRAAFGGFAFIGPILFAVAGVVLAIGLNQVASDFVDQAPVAESGAEESDDPDESPREKVAEDLVDDSSTIQIATALRLPGALGLVVAMVYIPLWAMRTGLLTRFWATLGMALGVSLILLPFGLIAIVLWFGALAVLLAGWWPGGRPPAWDAGVAIPWPKPGEAPAEGGAVEGSGRELGEQPLPEGDEGEAAGGEAPPGRAMRPRRKRKRRR